MSTSSRWSPVDVGSSGHLAVFGWLRPIVVLAGSPTSSEIPYERTVSTQLCRDSCLGSMLSSAPLAWRSSIRTWPSASYAAIALVSATAFST